MQTHIALLRGINVGGNSKVDMRLLQKTFEDTGCTDVKTLLNSGNVIFASDQINTMALRETIEEILEKTFAFHIDVLVRTKKQIQELINANPFNNIPVTKDTRLYVTFLSKKPINDVHLLESPTNGFQILRITDLEICSAVTLSPQKNTTDLMKMIEKTYGKTVTTRNWNTIQKIANLLVE